MEKNTGRMITDPALTEKENTASRRAAVGTETKELTKEFTLPDYIPDVRRIVKSDARAALEETGRTGGGAGWECTVTFSVTLLCEDGTVRNVILQGRQDGEVRLECEADETDGLYLDVRLENSGIRASDPRKLTGRCRINVTAYGELPVRVEPELIGNEEGGKEPETRRETLEYTVIERFRIDDLRASYDIEFGSGEPEINDIVECEVTPYITSVRLDGTTAELRGEANVAILYSDAEGGYHSRFATLALSAETEIDSGKPTGSRACARIDEIKAAAQTNTYGEQKIIELDFSWGADLYVAYLRECRAVTDIYSTSDELEVKKGSVRLDRALTSFTDRFSVKGESSAEDLSLSRAVSADAYSASARLESVTDTDAGDLEFKGAVTICLLCSASDEGEKYAAGEMKLPFTYVRKVDAKEGKPECSACVTLTGCRVKLEGGRFTADADLCICAMVIEPYTREVVTGATVTGPAEDDRPPLTLYYPAEGDDLWNIAKTYRVPADSILARNGITADALKTKKVIAVPGK
ncbi:MAG: LysM peptidoglycan-binding domain-containing protein [Clostridia bacterium]|nr:LysM peptidoglycan-binding domain-containing protein [Clostridia bacterium]